jgi:hypothetical protein
MNGMIGAVFVAAIVGYSAWTSLSQAQPSIAAAQAMATQQNACARVTDAVIDHLNDPSYHMPEHAGC